MTPGSLPESSVPPPARPALADHCRTYAICNVVLSIVIGFFAVGTYAKSDVAFVVAAMAFTGSLGTAVFFFAVAKIIEYSARTAHYAKITAVNTRQLWEANSKLEPAPHGAGETVKVPAVQLPSAARRSN